MASRPSCTNLLDPGLAQPRFDRLIHRDDTLYLAPPGEGEQISNARTSNRSLMRGFESRWGVTRRRRAVGDTDRSI